MKYRSITNQDVTNLENCEDEQIHIPGRIQPHGFLIAFAQKSNKITVCSENVNEFLKHTHEDLLGKKISEIFNNEFIGICKDFLSEDVTTVKEFFFSFEGNSYAVTLHYSNGHVILECEPTENQFGLHQDLYNSTKQLLGYIQDKSTVKELSNSVAIAIKKITQYDRVMIYRFDEEYNGEVFAESKEPHLESFLGLHYPHTDIPKQARALYLKNHLRIIGDVNYESVPLYTYDASTVETLDLSKSILRSVSPIHIQYLHNMGVGATLTVSLINKGRLWGLIACHHYSPKYLTKEIRNTVKLHGHFITSQLDVRILNEQFGNASKVNAAVDKLTSKKLSFQRSSITELFKDDAIRELCNSCGVAAIVNGKVYTNGDTPSNDDIRLLGTFLDNFRTNGRYYTKALSRITPDFERVAKDFPGIKFYAMGDDHNFIMWFRTPTLKEISWAGNPNKAIVKDEKGLHPRKSFEKFTENVKDASKPWMEAELVASSNFTNFFQTHIRSIIINEEKENQRRLAKILQETNAELENINWISTHDLQEPLRKIRFMASTLISKEEDTNFSVKIIDRISRIQHSAERMQTLISDILKYTRTSSETSSMEDVDLNDVLAEIAQDIQHILKDSEITLEIKQLPKIQGIPFLLKQLFLNIIYNSIKFKHPDRLPHITVEAVKEYDLKNNEAYHLIEISDNGIGFDNEYKEKIFKIFSRLNSRADYDGSGIGLALCKKIMSKHEGMIEATGEENNGATIKLYFPKHVSEADVLEAM